MSSWPASLPQVPLLRGFAESQDSAVVRTETEGGPAKTRRRFTATVKRHSVPLVMSRTQKNTLQTFFDSTLGFGAEAFDWVDFDDLTTVVSYRFVDPPAFQPLGNERFRTVLNLEVML